MILAMTLNPSVDISYKLEQFSIDQVNRAEGTSKTAGGKGLNVSRVLQQLNEEVAVSGFLGGSLGDFIRRQLRNLEIRDFFTTIDGETRNCIAVIHEGKQTEILESGPMIAAEEAQQFLDQFTYQIEQMGIVTISGSLPQGLPDNFYQKMIGIANQHKVPVFLDTNGKLLKKTLQGEHKPFLIKPNAQELAEFAGRPLDDEKQIINVLNDPLLMNVPHIVVTLGARGSLIKQNEHIYRASTPAIQAVNPVGSGDSVIAGFAAGLSRGLIGKEWIKFGMAMGVLNTMEAKTGHINPENIDWCKKQIGVTLLE
ncbi:hexose kinase [Virgibacillus sp. NKC19-3]|uniref:hexose kinase n=1 Tax=Virgibacillus saliphilus TaxID=2831674 RepID=UPI001C9B167B|nr:hexose kinase [Virgibacillus sp. NKC19-3]MBY7144554.1 hexose kinase [Virgibacillus sp. NKC19-3]